jgi:polyhydroxybutyrate depolymerase
MPPATAVSCNPGRPISALIIHGTADPLVPFNGGNVSVPPLLGDGGWVLSFNATVERWVQLDGCATTPVTTELPMAVNDGTSVVRDSYGPCAQGTAVEAYIIDGGGHTWPDGPQYAPTSIVGKASQNLNASQVIWAFLQQYSLPQTG